jgi:protein ImuB
MSVAHARALVGRGGVRIEPYDPSRDARALRALAAWAIRLVPVVAPDPPNGLLMDVTGCERLYRGERRLLNTVVNRLEWMGVHARAATAATFGCAWAVARFGGSARALVAVGEERRALAPLPVEALRLDAATIEALHEVGVDRVGQVLELPRLELATRFDELLLRRLDQALGDTGETIDPVRPAPALRVERCFDGPVKQPEGIALATRQLVETLAGRLGRRESGALQLELEVERLDAAPVREVIRLSRPSRDVKHLRSLLEVRVQRLDLAFGVERLVLAAPRTGRLPHVQGDVAEDDGDADAPTRARQWGQLVDTLSDRLGAERAVHIEPVPSHRPERAFRRRVAIEHGGGAGGSGGSGVSGGAGGGAALVLADRPSRLLRRPEPIEVMALAPDGPVCRARWRGRWHAVVRCVGPERIAGEWWRDEGAEGDVSTRDYFKVQGEGGRWLWVYRELETERWFVHGEWA